MVRMAVVALVIVGIAGCGGGGEGESTSSPSPFAGHWTAAWTNAINAETGTVDMVIATNGAITGTLHYSTVEMPIAGTISNAGMVDMGYSAGVSPNVYVYRATGTLTIQSSGHLTGVLQIACGGVAVGSAPLDLAKQ